MGLFSKKLKGLLFVRVSKAAVRSVGKRSALLAKNKPPNMKKKIASQSTKLDLSRFCCRPTRKLRVRPVQSVDDRKLSPVKIRYMTTATGEKLPFDLAMSMETAGALLKQIEAAGDHPNIRYRLESIEIQIDHTVASCKGFGQLDNDWNYDRATAILYAP